MAWYEVSSREEVEDYLRHRYQLKREKADASTAEDADGYAACVDRARARGYLEAMEDIGITV